MIANAKVVFPEPLSPTIPNVSPSEILRVALLTAFTYPTTFRIKPLTIGNHTFIFLILMISKALAFIGLGAPDGSAFISFFVYACIGELKISFVDPTSTICPSFITQTRSAMRLTTLRSCVINNIPMPSDF